MSLMKTTNDTIILGSPYEYKSETGATDYRRAQSQFRTLKERIESHGVGTRVVPAKRGAGLIDFVYISNSALIINDFAILARYSKKSRRGEEGIVGDYLRRMGLRVVELPHQNGLYFEGAGDCRFSHQNTHLWIGYGTGRSSLKGIHAVRQVLQRELSGDAPVVHPMRIVRPVTFHIDLAMLPLPNGRVLYHRSSFSPEALRELNSVFTDATMRVNVPEKYHFACNSVVVGGQRDVYGILVPRLPFPEYEEWMRDATKMTLDVVDVSEFHIGRGSVSCMCLRMFKVGGAV